MNESPAFRRDPLQGWWTVVAPGRDDRPVDRPLRAPGPIEGGLGGASFEDGCPFCPGHEAELAEVLEELPGADGWTARAVRNRYPWFAPPPGRGTPFAAVGEQEVLIESRGHRPGFGALSPEVRRSAVELWASRLRAAVERADADGSGRRPVFFRNEGRDAGATRTHPHAQLVTFADPPGAERPLERRHRDHHARTGRCLSCDRLALDDGLTLLETPAHLVRLLDAPLDPGHLRIFPREHRSGFGAMSPPELHDLADLLGRLARGVDRVAGTSAWSLMLHDLGPDPDPALHWHLEFRPRRTRIAGFELATGTGVCALPPFDALARWRRVLDDPDESTLR